MLFNVILRNISNTEKHLMIDVKMGREAHSEGVKDDVIEITMQFNLADAMTEASILSELLEALDNN